MKTIDSSVVKRRICEMCIVSYCIKPSHAQWVHKGIWDMIVTGLIVNQLNNYFSITTQQSGEICELLDQPTSPGLSITRSQQLNWIRNWCKAQLRVVGCYMLTICSWRGDWLSVCYCEDELGVWPVITSL